MEEKISFEDNMKKLEEIATELEKGDLDLDDFSFKIRTRNENIKTM